MLVFKKIINCKNYKWIFSIFLIILFFELCSHIENKKVITVALFNAPASESLIRLIPDFETKFGIKVDFEILPYSELKSKVEQQFFSKSGNYDVIMADCIWIPSFADRKFLKNLDLNVWKNKGYDLEDIFPALDDYLGKYPKGGVRYGMPFMSNTHMMAYHPDIVKPIADSLKLNLPGETVETAWTWDEYLKVAKAIFEKKVYYNGKQVYGTSLQARAGAWIIYEWNSELFGFVDDKNARITGLPIFDQRAINAMQYYSNLYKYAPKESLTWGHEEETSAMCSKLCAMDATSNVELASNLLSNSCGNNGTIAFSYPPKGVGGIGSPDMGGYGLILSAFSKKTNESSLFVLWAASKEIHKKIVLEGGSPIRISEIRSKEILDKYPYLKFYDSLIRDSVYRARIPQWPELQDILSRELISVMKGEKKANEAIKNIQIWIQENLKK